MANTYISRTLGTPTSQLICTFSAWVKRAAMDTSGGGDNYPLFYSSSTAGEEVILYFHSTSGQLSCFCENGAGTNFYLQTSADYRDPAAWYHIVMTLDNSQSQADRVKLYVNGTQPALGTDTQWSNTSTLAALESGATMAVGGGNVSGGAVNKYYKGEMSHVHFTDGYAYAASTFGETDLTSGIWKIKTAPSVTYGNNGFFLKMEDRTNLDLDSGTNTLTMTTGGTLTPTYDNPSNNFATLNPLAVSSYTTLENGNTVAKGNNAGDNGNISANLCANAGKWYAECKFRTLVSGYPSAGVYQIKNANFGKCENGGNSMPGYYADECGFASNGNLTVNNSSTGSWGSTPSAGDIIQVAIDNDNGAVYIGINNTWQNSGVPTSGGTKTGAAVTWTPGTTFTGTTVGSANYNNSYADWNFGNGYFATTAVTSAEADGAGIGAFEYAPPTGYYALCTKNIKAYGG